MSQGSGRHSIDVNAQVTAVLQQRDVVIERLRTALEAAHAQRRPKIWEIAASFVPAATEEASSGHRARPRGSVADDIPPSWDTFGDLHQERLAAVRTLRRAAEHVFVDEQDRFAQDPVIAGGDLIGHFIVAEANATKALEDVEPVWAKVKAALQGVRDAALEVEKLSQEEPNGRRSGWRLYTKQAADRRRAESARGVRDVFQAAIVEACEALRTIEVPSPDEYDFDQKDDPRQIVKGSIDDSVRALEVLGTRLDVTPPTSLVDLSLRISQVVPPRDVPVLWKQVPVARVLDDKTVPGEREAAIARHQAVEMSKTFETFMDASAHLEAIRPILREAAVELMELENEFWSAVGHPRGPWSTPPANSDVERMWLTRADPFDPKSPTHGTEFSPDDVTAIIDMARTGSLRHSELNPWVGTLHVVETPEIKVGDWLQQSSRQTLFFG